MAKRALFTILAMSGLVVSLVTGVCFADALAQLEKVETYKWYPAQAEQIYQEITRDYPGSNSALTAHKNLIISYLSAKRDGDAQVSLNKLVEDFSGHSGLPEALYEIAKIYERSKKYEKAKSIYQQIIQQHSGSSAADKAQLTGPRINVLSHIESGDEDGAAGVLDSLIAGFSVHSELPMSLYDIARRYERAKKYEKATGLYQQIIQDYAGSSSAGKAQLGVRRVNIMSLIESGSDAGGAVDSLISDFAGHSDLSEALYDIARGFEVVKKYAEAKSVYQQVISQHAGSSHAARAGLIVSKIDIFSLIESGDYSAATVAVDKLVGDFSGHSYLPAVLRGIARAYERVGRYKQSNSTYQQIVQGYGGSWYAGKAEVGMARNQALIYVDAGNDAAVQAEVDKLVNDYHSPGAVSRVAKQYQDKGKYREAIGIYDKVIIEFAGSTAAAEACYLAGNHSRKLGEYKKSTQYYQKVVDDYSGYRLAWSAQFMIGRNYEELKESGALSKSEADAKIKRAYQQVIEKYPDCKAAKIAWRWLSHHN